jgi:hypothetical protein
MHNMQSLISLHSLYKLEIIIPLVNGLGSEKYPFGHVSYVYMFENTR